MIKTVLTSLTGFVLLVSAATSVAASLKPNTEYRADEVVKIVIEALRTNMASDNDSGIETVFRFASPGNKSVTGPLERFSTMLKGSFGIMLNHVASEYSEMEISDNKARQVVWLSAKDGFQYGFVFEMGLQSTGEYTGMWMTEGVWPIGKRKAPDQSI